MLPGAKLTCRTHFYGGNSKARPEEIIVVGGMQGLQRSPEEAARLKAKLKVWQLRSRMQRDLALQVGIQALHPLPQHASQSVQTCLLIAW